MKNKEDVMKALFVIMNIEQHFSSPLRLHKTDGQSLSHITLFMSKLYLLQGLSGVGKTHLGKYAATKLAAVFIDQDSYYKKVKPEVTLSDGTIVKNWDCVAALDWEKMENEVMGLLQKSDVVLAGFALRDDHLGKLSTYVPQRRIELVYGDQELSRCKAARKKAKNINEDRDALVIQELVIPFYMETKARGRFDKLVRVYEGEERKSVEKLYKEGFS